VEPQAVRRIRGGHAPRTVRRTALAQKRWPGPRCYARRIRCRSRANPARPYICRFRNLTLVLAPSIGPLL
jgi:hypothetical protein